MLSDIVASTTKNILLIGGTGFIGRNIIDYVLKQKEFSSYKIGFITVPDKPTIIVDFLKLEGALSFLCK